jgi:hypothetical protein
VTFTVANDLPYQGQKLEPLEALGDVLAFSADDWGETRAMAWVWGIVLGWDDDASAELAAKFRWSAEQIARMQALHERFDALAEQQQATP